MLTERNPLSASNTQTLPFICFFFFSAYVRSVCLPFNIGKVKIHCDASILNHPVMMQFRLLLTRILECEAYKSTYIYIIHISVTTSAIFYLVTCGPHTDLCSMSAVRFKITRLSFASLTPAVHNFRCLALRKFYCLRSKPSI